MRRPFGRGKVGANRSSLHLWLTFVMGRKAQPRLGPWGNRPAFSRREPAGKNARRFFTRISGVKDPENEFDLLERFAADGDEAAFAAVLARWEKPLFAFIFRLIPERTEAEDIEQEVFLKIAAAAGGLERRAKFSTYLYRVAYNLSVDRLRRRAVRGNAAAPESLDELRETGDGEAARRQVPDPSDLPADLLREREETGLSVRAALAALPEHQRAALVLKVYEDRSYAEIAEILGVSVPSVESLLFRARQSLRAALKSVREQLR